MEFVEDISAEVNKCSSTNEYTTFFTISVKIVL